VVTGPGIYETLYLATDLDGAEHAAELRGADHTHSPVVGELDRPPQWLSRPRRWPWRY